jgi:hypothetical protein
MSTETVMNLTLDTRTILTADFTCSCKILILSPHLTELPGKFLYNNVRVKILDMSKCTNITEIPDYFCKNSNIENIIWPPNIKNIHNNCLQNNLYIRKINLSYCNKLTFIGNDFCTDTNITELLLPISIHTISNKFLYDSKIITHLDLSYCINLTYIGTRFCAYTNIQYIRFPKSLKNIREGICCNVKTVRELDFELCVRLSIHTFLMCDVETLKLYSIDSIDKKYKIQCKDLHIYNVTENKYLDLTFIKNLNNIYLPDGKYCIVGEYPGVKFWLHDVAFSAEYFSTLRCYSYIPVNELALIDILLETV